MYQRRSSGIGHTKRGTLARSRVMGKIKRLYAYSFPPIKLSYQCHGGETKTTLPKLQTLASHRPIDSLSRKIHWKPQINLKLRRASWVNATLVGNLMKNLHRFMALWEHTLRTIAKALQKCFTTTPLYAMDSSTPRKCLYEREPIHLVGIWFQKSAILDGDSGKKRGYLSVLDCHVTGKFKARWKDIPFVAASSVSNWSNSKSGLMKSPIPDSSGLFMREFWSVLSRRGMLVGILRGSLVIIPAW